LDDRIRRAARIPERPFIYIRPMLDAKVRSARLALLGVSSLLLCKPQAFGQEGPLGPAQVMAMAADTAKVLKLSDLCYAYRRIDGDSALLFGNAALRLAVRLNYARGEAQACNDMAIIHMDRSDYAGADSLLRRSLRIRTAIGDPTGVAAVHNKLGNIYQAQFKLEEALEEDLQALRIFERTGPPAHEALILNNIANLQFNLRRYDMALATHRKAAAIRERIGDGPGLAASQGNMANVEVQLGDTAAAVALYQKAIAFFRSNGLKQELAVQINNLAGVNLGRGEPALAAKQYQEALTIRTALGDQKAIASSMIGLGGAWLRQGRYRDAQRMLMAAWALGRELGTRNEQMQALLDLARLHAKQDHGDSSFFYHQQYVALKDSVFNDDLNWRLADAETKYETEKKERQIQAQRADLGAKGLAIAELQRGEEQRKFWFAVAIGTAALTAVSALLLMQVQRRRARAAKDAALITEREAGLRSVLEATETERKRIAGELHDGVGQQLTGLRFRLEDIAMRAAGHGPMEEGPIREALTIADDAGREVRNIAHALMPKALGDLGLVPAISDMFTRFLGAAGISHAMDHFGLEERVPPEVEVGTYRIAQELVQNTMKHAQATTVTVQLLRNRGHLVLIYEDNGRGLDGQGVSDGIGLHNIRERVRALRGAFTVENGRGQGVVATVRVPLQAASPADPVP
jgi:signal transduction histidine kinase